MNSASPVLAVEQREAQYLILIVALCDINGTNYLLAVLVKVTLEVDIE